MQITRARSIQLGIAVAIAAVLVVGGYSAYHSEWNQERTFNKVVAVRSAEERAGIEQLMRSARDWETKVATATEAASYVEAARYWKSIGDSYRLNYPRHRAIVLYEAAIDRFGDNPTIYAAMGDTYKAMEQYEDAEVQYQRAITVEPGQVSHYLKLADLYRYRMQAPTEQVLGVYATALERLIIGSPDVYKNRALYFESLGSYKAAAADWKAVFTLDPTNTAAKAEFERVNALVK